jgi:hypothetical protein
MLRYTYSALPVLLCLRIQSGNCVTERNVGNFKLLARIILQGKVYKIQVTSSQTTFIALTIGLTKLTPEKR